MKTVEELAREARLGTVLCHNSIDGERVWIEGADWHDELSRFRDLVLREAEKAVYAVKPVEPDMMPHEQFAFETAIVLAGDAIRAMKGQK